MGTSFAAALAAFVFVVQFFAPPVPIRAERIPDTGAPAVFAAPVRTLEAPWNYPSRVSIPSIALDSPIEYVGVNAKGEMDVPAGDTNHVGWYKHGAVPGERGSAVLDAHVYAAFKNLKAVAQGDEIYIEQMNGEKLRFVVSDVTEYALADLTPEMLFLASDTRITLITCAGDYIPSLGTYDRRLVVSAIPNA